MADHQLDDLAVAGATAGQRCFCPLANTREVVPRLGVIE